MKYFFTFVLLTLTTFANIGMVMAMKGKADIKRDTKLISATNGMDIEKGDEIITKLKTKVQIILNDGTAITVGPDSSFAFVDYFYDKTKTSKLSMKATRGFFRSVTGKIGKIAPERFKVKTNMATIGVRGTDFSALLRDTQSSYRCHSGEITVSFGDKVRSVAAGEQIALELDGSNIKEKKPKSQKVNGSIQDTSTFESVRIEDITDRTKDIQDIKYDCQTH